MVLILPTAQLSLHKLNQVIVPRWQIPLHTTLNPPFKYLIAIAQWKYSIFSSSVYYLDLVITALLLISRQACNFWVKLLKRFLQQTSEEAVKEVRKQTIWYDQQEHSN